ncbi:MAG: hypothetical protein VKS61_16240, partial [Candidatus Sericytochromatia bacterium]|nr:hypothetical protein [Candidatus Sericytochromatia bacterium]
MSMLARHLLTAALLLPLVPAGGASGAVGGTLPTGPAPPAQPTGPTLSLAPAVHPPAAPAQRLSLVRLSDWVDAVPVLPGARVALEPAVSAGARAAVTWRAPGGGTLAYGAATAVWTAPLTPGVYTLIGRGLVDGVPVARTLTCLVT